MAPVERGVLTIGDIAGYTKYLAGVELEHSQDVIADLMNVLVRQMRGLLHLAKLEGDAVFCYAHDADTDGSTLMAMIESCYFAFARRLRTIDRHTTCACNACRLIPTLNLKFLVHHGEYVIHDVAGNQELVGRDVILVHRMLKNSFTKRTGIRGYAMATERCVRHFGLDPARLGLTEHVEEYEDVGEVRAYAVDLEARWKAEQERAAVYIAPGEGLTLAEIDLPGPPAIVWHYLTAPEKRAQWQHDTVRVEELTVAGVRGIGTQNHCVHGGYVVEEEFLDWKPFRYVTDRSKTPIGSALFTIELTAVGDRTHVSIRMLPEGGAEAMDQARAALPMLEEMYSLGAAALARLLDEVRSEAAERTTGSVQTSSPLQT
jgi:uncharacterized protein YndB with AHSA1/START domain